MEAIQSAVLFPFCFFASCDYRLLNPKKWKPLGGDPCSELWTGVSCLGSSITHIDLHGQQLSGYIGGEFRNLHNLRHLDMGSNNIQGAIPYSLPLNVTHINFACNNFTQNIPHSLPNLSALRYLNLSHNSLNGPIGDVFTGLHSLKEMDLSYNGFSGDLPSSFQCLANLSKLFLDHNSFTGSVIFLAYLPLTDLDIQENHFSGVVPEQFQSIKNLWIDGNNFHIGGSFRRWNLPSEYSQNMSDSPKIESSTIENFSSQGNNFRIGGSFRPWNFPSEYAQCMSDFPKTEAIENFPSHKDVRRKKKLGPGGVIAIIGGATLLVSCAALLVATLINKSRAQKLWSSEGSHGSFNSLPSSAVIDNSSAASEDSSLVFTLTPPPIVTLNRVPKTKKNYQQISKARKRTARKLHPEPNAHADEADVNKREQKTSETVSEDQREIDYWKELQDAIARNSAYKTPSDAPLRKKEAEEGVVEKEKILIVTWWEQQVDYTVDVLRTIFSDYGVVENITIRDTEPGSMRRALVFMDSESAVAAAAAKGVCGDFRSPLHVFPLLSNDSPVQYSEAYEDYVMKKIQKAIGIGKL